jgi:hypothetical protein
MRSSTFAKRSCDGVLPVMPLRGIERVAVRLDLRPSKELLDRVPTVNWLALVVLREESAHRLERLAGRERLIDGDEYVPRPSGPGGPR